MRYKQLSGAKKRKLKSNQEAQRKALKGSMKKYVKMVAKETTSESQESSEIIIDDIDRLEKDCNYDTISESTETVAANDAILDLDVENNDIDRLEKDCNYDTISESTETVAANDAILDLDVENNDIDRLEKDCNNDTISESTETVAANDVFPSDVGLWPVVITNEFREHFVNNKPEQNIDCISTSKCLIGNKERSLNESNFYRRKKDKLIKREWLVYSPLKKSVFCYVCKLFSRNDQALCKNGFSDWKHINERLCEHENSPVHRDSVLCLSHRLTTLQRIDSKLVEDFQSECNYWRKVLYRVVAAIKFLSQRGLALFGNDETLQSSHNGNFLGILEFLSDFDPFIADHLSKYGNAGRGNVNYLSSTIVTEFIDIMGQKVLSALINEVKEAKYFGLIVDSTPDITHTDQLSIILRYVDKKGEPRERFLKFINIHSHDSDHLEKTVLAVLEENGIDVKNCRGQSYDNARNMSGEYSGLQTRIKNLSPLADYVPCAAHSLNLVGTYSAECCTQAISFFGLVQSLYVFFSVSTHRWEILMSKINRYTLKPGSSTRWCAAADATKCLRHNYLEIMESLQEISNRPNEKLTTRHDAKALMKKMETFEIAVLAVVWDTILQRINKVNHILQYVTGNVSILIPLYESLITFIQSVRDNIEIYEAEASKLVKTTYCVRRRRKIPKSRMLDDGKSENVLFSTRNKFIFQCHYVICDSLMTELETRKSAYLTIANRFGFLMKKIENEETFKKEAKEFQELYQSDIDEEFVDEVCQFLHFNSEDGESFSDPRKQLKTIRDQNITHTFPNVDIALQILLTMPITNCSSERSFSALKRIKNRLRSTTKQNKLSSLSILTIESDLTNNMNFEDVINTFAASKVRKACI